MFWGFVAVCLSNASWLRPDTPQAHTLKGCMYTAVGCGLPVSILTAVGGLVMVVASFVLKSWTHAIVTGIMTLLAVLMWLYFVRIPYPL